MVGEQFGEQLCRNKAILTRKGACGPRQTIDSEQQLLSYTILFCLHELRLGDRQSEAICNHSIPKRFKYSLNLSASFVRKASNFYFPALSQVAWQARLLDIELH